MFDKRLLKEGRQAWPYLALTVGLGIGTALAAVLQAWFFASAVSGVFLKQASFRAVEPALAAILGAILLKACLQWGSETAAHEAAFQIKSNLRQRLLQHIFALGPLSANAERSGELISTVIAGTDALDDYYAKYIPQLFLAVGIPLIILSIVFPRDWKSGCILLLTAPLIPLFMILIGKLAEKKSQRQWQSLSRLSGHFLDILRGITTLKVFGRSRDQIRVIARVSESFRETTLDVLKIAFLSALFLEFLATMSTALVAVSIGLRLVYGTLSYSGGLFLLLLAPEYYTAQRTLGLNFHAGLSGVSAAGRIFGILDSPNLNECLDSLTEPLGSFADNLQIKFEHVSLTYEQRESPALRDINLTIKNGERIVLVGPSGAGKTSIAQLLLRFVEPTTGQIFVNGKSLAGISPETWRQVIAYLPQSPYLFAGSILENIRLGKPQAELDEVIQAARLAHAHDFIQDFPLGYETNLGEGGESLSGGQVQRIALARAFLKNSPLLILDEPTSALDAENEEAVQAALEQLAQGKTTIMIAHHLNTIRPNDRILVIDQGRIAEAGNQEELIKKQGLYYTLVQKARGKSL